MPTSPFVPRRSVAAAVAILLLLGAALAAPAVASDHKTFTATVAPQAVAAGQRATVTATVTNTATQQQLGSVDIAVPGAFADLGGVTAGAGTATVSGSTIAVRDLSLQPGQSVDVSFDATMPCDTGPYTLGFAAKQANNFRGPPGNDLTLVGEPATRTVTVTGGCGRLAFVTQPAHAERGAVVTGSIGDPAATGVQVAVVDVDGQVLPVDVEVTIALGDDPSSGAATLSGTASRRTGSSGVATFGDLRLDTLGTGYTLVASSPGFDPVGSDPFGIWEDIAACTAGETCTSTVSRQRQLSVQVSGTGQQGSAMLLSVLGQEIDCAHGWAGPGAYPYNHAPATSLYQPVGTFHGATTVTLTIDKSEVRKVPNNGAAFYQVCYLGEKPFQDRDGQTAQANPALDGLFGPAVLPDCGSQGSLAAPCVISRTKTQGGDMVLVFAIPSQDPMFR